MSLLQDSLTLYRDLFHSSMNPMCYCQMIYNDEGQPVDYQIMDANPAFATMMHTDQAHVLQSIGSDLYQSNPPPHLLAYDHVVKTKKDRYIEAYISFAKRTYQIHISSPYHPFFFAIYYDITSIKRNLLELQEKDQFLQNLIENLSGFVYRCKFDKNWTMVYLSKGFEDLTGYPPSDVLHNHSISYNDIVHPDFQQSIWEKWNHIVKTPGTFQDEYPITTKSGSQKWVWEKGRAIYDVEGNVTYLEGFITDITHRKKMEISYQNSLLEEKQRTNELESLFEASKMIIKQKDFQSSFRRMFDLLCSVTSSTKGFIGLFQSHLPSDTVLLLKSIGFTLDSDTPIPISLHHDQALFQSMKHPFISSDIIQSFWKQYQIKPCPSSLSVIYTPIRYQSKTIGVIALTGKAEKYDVQDVKVCRAFSYLASLAYQHWESVRLMEENEKMKDQFVNHVSHELRKPLLAIQSCLRLLQNHPSSDHTEHTQELLSICDKNCQRLSFFIREILDFQKLKSSPVEPILDRVYLPALLQEVIKMIQPLADEKKLVIHNELPSTLSILHVNRDEMATLFSNLLHNAIKYTPKGSITICAKESQEQKTMHIQIRDTGEGIHEEDLPKLFSSFTRCSRSNKQNNSSGLGLSICKQIIERHQGKIWVDSQWGKGSTFHIQLPIQKNIQHAP
jgi:PAS domain S-box-containing protein